LSKTSKTGENMTKTEKIFKKKSIAKIENYMTRFMAVENGSFLAVLFALLLTLHLLFVNRPVEDVIHLVVQRTE
jgi:hypothetical protein